MVFEFRRFKAPGGKDTNSTQSAAGMKHGDRADDGSSVCGPMHEK
jgi:hypothetical protein